MTDFDDVSRFAHATVGVLSQYIPILAYLSEIGAMVSRTSQVSSSPAISRSLIVMDPFGLDCEIRFCWMSSGHSRRHTYGLIKCVPGSQTPPTPVFDEST